MLNNGNFEGGRARDTFTGQQFGEIEVPGGWTAWWREGKPVPHDPQNQCGYRRPECKVIQRQAPFLDPLRIQEGQQAWLCFTFYSIHEAGLYQRVQVTSGQPLRLKAWAQAWSSQQDNPHHSAGATGAYFALASDPQVNSDQRNFTFQVGIDPTGGVDPWGATVIWGPGAHIYNEYAQVPEVNATAQGNMVTVFLRSAVLWPFKHCDAYWDNVTLEPVEPEDQPEAGEGQPATVHLVPQNISNAELQQVIAVAYGQQQMVLYHTQAIADMIASGKPKPRVHVWWPERWGREAASWLNQQGLEVITQPQSPAPISPISPVQPPLDPEPPVTPGSKKLGVHIIKSTVSMGRLLAAKPPVVKFVGDWGSAVGLDPSVLVIGRKHCDFDAGGQFAQGLTPQQAAHQFHAAQIETYQNNPAIKYWEGHNEPVFSAPEQMRWYAQFEIERMKLLEPLGLKAVLGNFATGTPELHLWPEYLPAMQYGKTHGALLGLHEYSCPWIWWMTGKHQLDPHADEGDEGWTTLRYRKVYRQYLIPNDVALPLIITEAGVDPLVNPRPPHTPAGTWRELGDFWRTHNNKDDAAAYYFEQLRWYEAELLKDDYVLGATIFTWGSFGGTVWEKFDIAETQVGEMLIAYLE